MRKIIVLVILLVFTAFGFLPIAKAEVSLTSGWNIDWSALDISSFDLSWLESWSSQDAANDFGPILETQSIPIAASGPSNRYYPVVEPSQFFVWPGGAVSFSGKGFAPQEMISVLRSGNKLWNIKADSSGSISSSMVSLGYMVGKQEFVFRGEESGAVYSVRVEVGDRKPWIVLNQYYVPDNQTIGVQGFAYGLSEEIWIYNNGFLIGKAISDREGKFSFEFKANRLGENVLEAIGFDSSRSDTEKFIVY